MCIWKVEVQDRQCKFCKIWHCKDRPGNKTSWTGLAEKMRVLKLGEEVELQGKSYNSIRTQVCRYNKRDLGRKYITLHINDTVYVKRVK